jgi:hypothetical protein
MMRCRTRFNADEARRQLLKERQDVAALELTANNDIPCGVDAMDLKDQFGDVETDRYRNLLHVWLPSSWPPRRRPAHLTYVEVKEPYTASTADFAEVGTRRQTSCQTGRLEFMMPWLRNGCDLAMCAVLLALTRAALASPPSDLIGTATTYVTQAFGHASGDCTRLRRWIL